MKTIVQGLFLAVMTMNASIAHADFYDEIRSEVNREQLLDPIEVLSQTRAIINSKNCDNIMAQHKALVLIRTDFRIALDIRQQAIIDIPIADKALVELDCY